MNRDCADWLDTRAAPAEPTLLPVAVEPSPEGADDVARLLSVASFNGLCRLLTAMADRGLLCVDELRGIEDAITTPLDDPEWRNEEVVAFFRDTATSVAAQAVGRTVS